MRNEKKKSLSNKQKLELVSFLNVYLTVFTKCQRRIWKFLQRFRCDHPRLFMSTDYIARLCKCSRRTVQSATKLFVQMGILSKIVRNYATNIYDIPDLYLYEKMSTFKRCEEIIESLQKEDRPEYPSPKTVFLERKLHPSCTLSSLSTNFMNNTHEYVQRNLVNPEIAGILKKETKIPESEYAKFSRFAPYVLLEALKKADWGFRDHHKRGDPVRDPIKFLLSIGWREQDQYKNRATNG